MKTITDTAHQTFFNKINKDENQSVLATKFKFACLKFNGNENLIVETKECVNDSNLHNL